MVEQVWGRVGTQAFESQERKKQREGGRAGERETNRQTKREGEREISLGANHECLVKLN